MKDIANNSRGMKKMNELKLTNHMLTMPLQKNETSHPRCKNAADSVICSPTYQECQFTN